MELTRKIEKYLASRKVVKKAMQKALKGMQTKLNCKKNEDLAMVSLLKELEALTVMVFESLLTFIAGPKLHSKSNGWFVVSKLVHPKKVLCEDEETDANEFDKADAALQSLISHKTSKSDYSILVQNVQKWIGKLSKFR
nr:uncharacterized protein LOC112018385 [Quercus suber]POF18305.1 hypothetical protein CFP56_47550 [Quercus suber]